MRGPKATNLAQETRLFRRGRTSRARRFLRPYHKRRQVGGDFQVHEQVQAVLQLKDFRHREPGQYLVEAIEVLASRIGPATL